MNKSGSADAPSPPSFRRNRTPGHALQASQNLNPIPAAGNSPAAFYFPQPIPRIEKFAERKCLKKV